MVTDSSGTIRRITGATLLCVSVALVVWATLLPGHEIPADALPPAWCLYCGSQWLTDAIANVALFVPVGMALGCLGLRVSRATAVGALATLIIETLQWLGFPPGRSAAVADLMTNTVGTLIGAAVAVHAAWLWRPPAHDARRLWSLWSLGAVLVLWATAEASAPDGPLTEGAVSYARSPLTHVPDMAYFGGINDSAVVGGRRFARGWAGPIIVQASGRAPRWEGTVFVRGREPEFVRVPVLAIHVPGDSASQLRLTVFGDAAELDATRRGFRWGLRMPTVRIRDALRSRTARDARPLSMRGVVARDSLVLEVERHGELLRRVTLLTPLLGWAFIQPVVALDDVTAPVAALLWMAFLLVPAMWWAARDRTALAVLSVAVVVCGALFALPAITGAAAISALEWTGVVVVLVLAFFGSRLAHRGRAR